MIVVGIGGLGNRKFAFSEIEHELQNYSYLQSMAIFEPTEVWAQGLLVEA